MRRVRRRRMLLPSRMCPNDETVTREVKIQSHGLRSAVLHLTSINFELRTELNFMQEINGAYKSEDWRGRDDQYIRR